MRRVMVALATMACALLPATAGASTLTASPSTFAAQLSASQPGDTVQLAAGTYTLPAVVTSKAAPGVTISPSSGAAVRFASTTLNSTRVVSGVTFNGTGGTLDFGDLEICQPSHDTTWRNVRWNNAGVVIRTRSGAGSCNGSGEIVNANLLFDHDQFLNFVPNGGLEGRVHLPCQCSSQSSGITIQNSLFSGGTGDGIQSGAVGVKIVGNEFANLIDQGTAHTDPIQIWGARDTLVQGNYLHDDTTGIMNYDGGNSNNVIADNVLIRVVGDNGVNVIELGGGTGEQVIHNTIVGAGKRINFGSKSGQQARNVTVRDNISPGGVVSSGVGSAAQYTVNDWNLCNAGCSGAHALIGSASFLGGPSPSSYAGFALTPGSLGTTSASDGLDRGIRAGSPPPPPVDRDSDGVPDDKDACPDVPGTGADGCPPPPPPADPVCADVPECVALKAQVAKLLAALDQIHTLSAR